MTSKTLISMQRAIARGLVFEQWWKEQSDFPHEYSTQKDRAKVEYVQLENANDRVLKPFKKLIVTDRNGWPPERLKFVIHNDPESAAAHGLKTLGKGNFVLKEWGVFKNTSIHRQMTKTIGSYNRIFKFRKSTK